MSGKKRKYYSREYKEQILALHYYGGRSLYSLSKEYGILYSALWGWTKKCSSGSVSSEKVVPLPSEHLSEDEMANRSKDDYKDENAQLKKRVRELEKALEFSRLETLARDMMIDKAEEYFDIAIRKKSGAK